MSLPLFYEHNISGNGSFIVSEDTSRHIVQVLRLKKGQELQLTNGKGQTFLAALSIDHKKAAEVNILSMAETPYPMPQITIAISLIKNKNRFEWFLEKATEIGIQRIIPMICERTEKEYFRHERLNSILISAMLQSQQSWLPLLTEPLPFSAALNMDIPNRFIAHCHNEKMKPFVSNVTQPGNKIILIGPEGDFTKQEIDLASEYNFIPVSLGDTRLRTETAGMVACVLLNSV